MRCRLFSAAHGTYFKMDHILGHEANFNKFKKIEITPYIILDYNGIKLELNKKRNNRKYSNIRVLNSTMVNGRCIIKHIWEEVKKFLKSNENEDITYQNLWDTIKAMLQESSQLKVPTLKKQRHPK
jgi:hypothetical protein